jgi:thioredoxin 1
MSPTEYAAERSSVLAIATPRDRGDARQYFVLCLLAGVLLAMTAGGCAESRLTNIATTGEFKPRVLDAKQPALVLFYKEGCPACAIVEPTLSDLAKEYEGRVLFFKCPLVKFPFFQVNTELAGRYKVNLYPTVLVFVYGQEGKRWVGVQSAADYRKVLDQFGASSGTRPATLPTKPAVR